MNFSRRLKKIRENKGISMQELSNKLNMSRQGYSKYEDINLNTSPTIDRTYEIANALNVSIGYLLGITDKDDKPIKHNESVIYQDNDFKLLSDTREVSSCCKGRLYYDLRFDTEEIS